MPPLGRPRTVAAPPCPKCGTDEQVTALGLQDVQGEPRRSFRCRGCGRTFVPGVDLSPLSSDLKAAVRRVRVETEVPYRLLASAITNNLGLQVSHTTVAAWCQEGTEATAAGEAAPCEYLSILWALQREIQEERRGARPRD